MAAVLTRRQILFQSAAAGVAPLLSPASFAHAEERDTLRFRALLQGTSIGEHQVAFRREGDRLTVETQIDITARFLFFDLFRLQHAALEVWLGDRLVSVTSTTNHDGVHLEVYGEAIEGGFRIVGEGGPFLAAGNLLTSNSLWNSRIVRETRLIDVQHGGEVGMIARLLGNEQIVTQQGLIDARRYQLITPYYAGSVYYDADERWVKALVELKGETLEYVPAS
ncbi:DUF6134 family protein [Pelagibius sp. CAU 1746]|uniref:DUF6134 family protein n=1 Tax=Pelagibius sp. CAU 1746 TaxID=3140370 RepID=UPI00325B03AF